jgi:5-methylthioadenosine/S-adenosylhomocysteine deaminase
MPLNHAARQVVFQEIGAGVESLMVGGRFIVRARRLLTVDLDRLRRDAEAANERLLAANRAGAELVRRLEPIVGAFCVGLAKERYHVHRYADH